MFWQGIYRMYKLTDVLDTIMAIIIIGTRYIVLFSMLFLLITAIFSFFVAVVVFRILLAFTILWLTMKIITNIERYTENGDEQQK